jgi:hypothetical protein
VRMQATGYVKQFHSIEGPAAKASEHYDLMVQSEARLKETVGPGTRHGVRLLVLTPSGLSPRGMVGDAQGAVRRVQVQPRGHLPLLPPHGPAGPRTGTHRRVGGMQAWGAADDRGCFVRQEGANIYESFAQRLLKESLAPLSTDTKTPAVQLLPRVFNTAAAFIQRHLPLVGCHDAGMQALGGPSPLAKAALAGGSPGSSGVQASRCGRLAHPFGP